MGLKNAFRSDAMIERYLREIKNTPEYCALCQKPSVSEFRLWRTIINDYPYDLVAAEHHMLVPKRHVSEADVSEEEWREFRELKAGPLNERYDYYIEGTHRIKSIPGHFHVHLIVGKE